MCNSIYNKMFLMVAFLAITIGAIPVNANYVPDYWAYQLRTPAPEKTPQLSGRIEPLQCAKELLGTNVKNQHGVLIGSVEDVIVNGNKNTVSYIIISSDGKFYPVKWSAFNITDKNLELNIAREQLLQAPVITSIDTALLSSPYFENKVRSFYSEKISTMKNIGAGERAVGWMKEKAHEMAGREESPRAYKCREILGLPIRDVQGKDMAKLDNIIFDIHHGSIAYGLARFGGFLGAGTRTSAVPWTAITLKPAEGYVMVNADKAALLAAEVKNRDLSKLNEAGFAREIHQNFDRTPYWEVFGFEPPVERVPMTMKERAKDAWSADSDYNSKFDPENVIAFEGTVKSVGTFRPAEGAIAGLELKVETADGETLVVHAGPHKHYLKQDIRFEIGDRINVTGSEIQLADKNVIMSCRITKGDKTYIVRDEMGKPLWETHSPARESSLPYEWTGAGNWLIY